jgi:hypothetical protein
VPEDCVGEGTTAAGVVAEVVGAGIGAVGDGDGLCMQVHAGLGAGVVGGGVGWWCRHPHVGVGAGEVGAGGVGTGALGDGVLVPSLGAAAG